MNNRAYGKTMKHLWKRVKLDQLIILKVLQKIFTKNFVAIHEIQPVLTLDKQINVGFSTLDLSKLLINKFPYKYIGRKSDNCARLLFTDTASLVYEIETDDVYVKKTKSKKK